MTRLSVSKTIVAALLFFCAAMRLCGAEFKTDSEGFIQNWLLLGPIKIPEGQGATDIDKQQVADESKLAPKKGVKAIVFKIINDKNDWQGALRFKTKDDKAVTNLKIKLAP